MYIMMLKSRCQDLNQVMMVGVEMKGCMEGK